MSRSFELPDVEWATVGTVGPPGQRTFYLQARQGDAADHPEAREAAGRRHRPVSRGDPLGPAGRGSRPRRRRPGPVGAGPGGMGGRRAPARLRQRGRSHRDPGRGDRRGRRRGGGRPCGRRDRRQRDRRREIGVEEIGGERSAPSRRRRPMRIEAWAGSASLAPRRRPSFGAAGTWSRPDVPPAPCAVTPSIPKVIRVRGPTATAPRHPEPLQNPARAGSQLSDVGGIEWRRKRSATSLRAKC